MAKLLRAGIRRYLHSIVFWLAFIATAAIACICATEAKKYGVEDIHAVIGFLINAILIVMLVGREYSDGGFRNKVINGHTKGNIFISELILGVGIVLLFSITFFAIFFAITNYVFTVFPTVLILKMFFDCVLTQLAFTAVLVTVCCLVSNRTIAAIASIVLVLVMIFCDTAIRPKLSQPEFIPAFSEEFDTISEQKNPAYVDGVERTILETIYNLSPYGHMKGYIIFTSDWFKREINNGWGENGTQYPQTWEDIANQFVAEEISEDDHKNVENNLLYSAILLLGVSVIGFIGFRKKELK